MSIDIFDCLIRERDICIKAIKAQPKYGLRVYPLLKIVTTWRAFLCIYFSFSVVFREKVILDCLQSVATLKIKKRVKEERERRKKWVRLRHTREGKLSVQSLFALFAFDTCGEGGVYGQVERSPEPKRRDRLQSEVTLVAKIIRFFYSKATSVKKVIMLRTILRKSARTRLSCSLWLT